VDRHFDRGDRHWGRIWGRPVAVAGYVEDVPEVGSRGDEEQESCAAGPSFLGRFSCLVFFHARQGRTGRAGNHHL
jgi:hypothetical protein